MPSLFDNLQTTADGAVLHLPSVLTDSTLQSLNYEAVPTLTSTLTIDAQAVSDCDSVGIAVLVWLLQCAVQQRVEARFVNLPPIILRLLALYHLQHKDLIFNAGTTD